MDAAPAILFASRTGVRLGVQAQRAYVDSTRGADLVLPLPNFNPNRDFASAEPSSAGRSARSWSPPG